MGELLGMKLEDLDLDSNPIRLTIRSSGRDTGDTKEGGSRTIFADKEAKEALQRWIKARPGWLEAAAGKTNVITRIVDGKKKQFKVSKDRSDPHVFPISQVTVHTIYNNALARAGYLKKDPRTGIATLHFHTLRKFFRTRLGPVLPQDIVEALSGRGSAVVQVYRKYTIDQLAEFYRKAEPHLWTLSDVGDMEAKMEDVKQSSDALVAKIDAQQGRIDRLEAALATAIAYLKSGEPADPKLVEEYDREKVKRKEGPP
jgi:integrase